MVRFIKCTAFLTAITTALLAAGAPALADPEVGYGRIAPDSKPGVAVERPVLVVMMDFQDQGFAPGHDAAFFRQRLFGPGFPNVRDLYIESSGGLFRIREAGIVGPVRMLDDPATQGVNESISNCLPATKGCEMSSRSENRDSVTALRLATEAGFNAKAFDQNGDGKITDAELMVVVVSAASQPPFGGLARPMDPPLLPVGAGPGAVEIRLRLLGAFSEGTNIQTIAHEMTHTLGAVDLYGPWNPNFAPAVNIQSTLMGATAGGPDQVINLDAWTRIQLGWAKPRLVNLRSAGQCLFLDATSRRGAPRAEREPIVLWDPARANEFFILEYRSNLARKKDVATLPGGTPQTGYDTDVRDTGLAVWAVRHDATGNGAYPTYTAIERRGNPANGGPKPTLMTTPTGDDVATDADGDGAPDLITWGPDNVLQTQVLAGSSDIAHGGHAVFVASPQPRGSGWQTGNYGGSGNYLKAGHGEFALVWPGALDSGFRVQVGQTTTNTLAVRVATPSGTGAQAAGVCEDQTAGPPTLDAPACLERPTAVSPDGRRFIPRGVVSLVPVRVFLSRPVSEPTALELLFSTGDATVRSPARVNLPIGATMHNFTVEVASTDFDEVTLFAEVETTPVAGGAQVVRQRSVDAFVRVTPDRPLAQGDIRFTCRQSDRLQAQTQALRHLKDHRRMGPDFGPPHFTPRTEAAFRALMAATPSERVKTERFDIPPGFRVMQYASGAVELVPSEAAPAPVDPAVLASLESSVELGEEQLVASAAKIREGAKPQPVGMPTATAEPRWHNLGGKAFSNPKAVAYGKDRLAVLTFGTDGEVYCNRWNGSLWTDWQKTGWGNAPARSQIKAVSWGDGRLDAFVVGGDAQLYHAWWQGSEWSAWEPLGGNLTGEFDVVSWSAGRLDIFARDIAGGLGHLHFENGWSGWESVLSGDIKKGSAVKVVSWAPQRLDIFVVRNDQALHHLWFDKGWGTWESLGGGIAGQMTVASFGINHLDVFGEGNDGAVWHKNFDLDHWDDWQSLGGTVVHDSGMEAVAWGDNRLDVFVKGLDNALYHAWWGGDKWSPFVRLGGQIRNNPTVATWGQDRLDIFATGDDHSIWQMYWNGEKWGW